VGERDDGREGGREGEREGGKEGGTRLQIKIRAPDLKACFVFGDTLSCMRGGNKKECAQNLSISALCNQLLKYFPITTMRRNS